MQDLDLYKIIEPIKLTTINRLNKSRKWEYGYNEDHDVIIISKTGKIGKIYQFKNPNTGLFDGIKVALPLEPKTLKKGDNKWVRKEYPKELSRIKSIFEWKDKPQLFKNKWTSYIDEEFNRREEGFWFTNNKEKTYITGSHYTYLQWSKIDIGYPDFREANRLFFIFWEACKADHRCYGINYIKNRRSGFSFMGSSETSNQGTIFSDARFGILSKTGPDAKKMFTDKVVPIVINYPFFFKPIQDGMDRPKTELAFRVPASKITKKGMVSAQDDDYKDLEGLDTTIDWRNTGDNSYDGEKLKLLIHDESGKWEKPSNITNNWKVTKTCLRLGRKIVGKCMMGSTVNALKNGGGPFKKIFEGSNVSKRNANGQTREGLYSMFIPMEWNYEGYLDAFGHPVFNTPESPVLGADGEYINIGVIDYWKNEEAGLKEDVEGLNEFYRQFPRTVQHAFRDEIKSSLFNLNKIYEQQDWNDFQDLPITRGSFSWHEGVQDHPKGVKFTPNDRGRFLISWVPHEKLQNSCIIKNGLREPGNDRLGAFGCDSYDISGTVDGRGSKGALHGLTRFNLDLAPSNHFFLEYISRPDTADIFFEDVLMALVFYGMPMLAENNKPRLLYHLKKRGYRRYALNRPDKTYTKLSVTEKEIGGIPNSSEDVRQIHAAAIESYIDQYVGVGSDGEMGSMYFSRTLNDWARFDITKRTKHDATISSGLAIMACNRGLYYPREQIKRRTIDLGIKRYSNKGVTSKLIEQNIK
jgi:hypothetical protein